MGWATAHIAALGRGETVSFRPRGNSMTGRVDSGALCTVEPSDASAVRPGDVVLCRVGAAEYLHIVKAIDAQGRCQIGNNKGRINGWTSKVFGRLVSVDP